MAYKSFIFFPTTFYNDIMVNLQLKRVYDPIDVTDGERILVERLWPRGIRKSTQKIDIWIKDVAPSTALRKWFAHDPSKWEEFKNRYRQELETTSKAGLLKLMGRIKSSSAVTLLYSTKDPVHNNAIFLMSVVKEKLSHENGDDA